jgi:hypothetical protein
MIAATTSSFWCRPPMSLEIAARFVGMRVTRARWLLTTPEFRSAFDTAIEAYRATLEPGNLAMALRIRDDATQRARDRLKAAEFLRGAKPAAAATVVSVTQNNTAPAIAGYVLNLGVPMREHEKAIAGEIIDAPAPGNVGEAAADVAQERRESHRFRPR